LSIFLCFFAFLSIQPSTNPIVAPFIIFKSISLSPLVLTCQASSRAEASLAVDGSRRARADRYINAPPSSYGCLVPSAATIHVGAPDFVSCNQESKPLSCTTLIVQTAHIISSPNAFLLWRDFHRHTNPSDLTPGCSCYQFLV
ncbi:hypothetical protein KCU83_g579, partial [Aureobasidium melanogenum]